jgi:CubicO group peptidase (beta-lactamase class C family)
MNYKIKYILAGLILIIFGCNKSQDSANYQQFIEVKYNQKQSLDVFATDIQQYYLLPGVAMAKINDTSIKEVAIKGWNKVRQGIALNSDSKFNIGSCGKSFTALLAATFVEEGRLSWETKISDIFSDMQIHEGFKDITLRQLLSHTAGIRHFWTDEEVFEVEEVIPNLEGTTIKKRKIFTEWNLSQKPYFDPGVYQYSNAAYVIIAAMLETISGKSFEQLMQARIFKPLNLESAEFGYPFLYDSTQPHRHMRRYNGRMGIVLNPENRMLDELFNPSGNISLTIEDFAKYVIFYIKALKGAETRIDYHLVQDLFKPVVDTERGNKVGMGWMIIYIDSVKTYGHTGSDGTSRSAMTIDPQTWNAVVFATNIGDDQAEVALINVVVELLGI